MCEYCNWSNEEDLDREPIFSADRQDVRKIVYGNDRAEFVATIKDQIEVQIGIFQDLLYVMANIWDFKSSEHDKGESYGRRAEINEEIKIKYCPFCGEKLEGREENFCSR